MPFRVTSHRGFQLTFENGWTVSVQFGPSNYCQHHSGAVPFDLPESTHIWESRDAEVAVWPETGSKFVRLGGHDDVVGWVEADAVAGLISAVAGLAADTTLDQAATLLAPIFSGLDDDPPDAS